MRGALLGLCLVAFPAAAQTVPKLTGTVDLVIGEGDQPPGPYLFEMVRSLTMDATGRILVADARTAQVRLYTADGKFIYAYGRPGEGPGDLGDP